MQALIPPAKPGIRQRTPGWLGRWRRLSRNCGQLPEVSKAMVTLAMLHRAVHSDCERLAAPILAAASGKAPGYDL